MSGASELPISLLDPSPFEPREKVTPLEDKTVITPLVVRQKGDMRFEVIAGHRRLETLRREGVETAPCRVIRASDEQAAAFLYRDNHEREDLTDYERGVFFRRFMEAFRVGERETSRRLNVDVSVVSLCLSVVRGREMVLAPANSVDSALYESLVTAHKIKEVNSLPPSKRADVLQAVVENRLSTDETSEVVSRVKGAKPIDEAVVQVVNERSARKAKEYRERKIPCPACGGRGWVLRNGER